MDFNYTKIRLGNWLYKNCFPLYNFTYRRFKKKNDREEIELLRKQIAPGAVVLDIGANIGFYAEILSEITGPKGKVYCFEPDSTNFRHLKKNTSVLKNVFVFNEAVSDKKQTIKVYKSKLLNVDHRTYPVNNYDSIEEIQAESIDGLIAEKKIDKPQFIKIDIQGYELSAFRGMEQLLSGADAPAILTEYWPHGLKRAGESATELYDFFDRKGYKFYMLENNKLTLIQRSLVAKNSDREFEYSFNVLIKKG